MHDAFTMGYNGKNNMGVDTSARHCIPSLWPFSVGWKIFFTIWCKIDLFTSQGYNIRVHKLFEEAGLVFPEKKRAEISEQAKNKGSPGDHNGDFTSVDTCNEVFC